jgi:iron complex outermembrane recepter protein
MKLRLIACAIAATQASTLAIAEPAKSLMSEVLVTAKQVRPGSPKDTTTTGSKTKTPLKDLPATVVVVPIETLRLQGAIDMNSAMVNASGVQPSMAGGYGFADNYTIRGLAMRFLRDGLPDGTSQNGYARTMYDVERIEVLKGPGSALYGSGQPGGTINVVSKQPRPGFGAEIGGMVGSYGTRGGYLDTWGSLDQDDKILGRVIIDREHKDGFRDLDRDITEFSPTLRISLDDDKTLTLDYDYRKNEITPDNYGIVFNTRGRLADVDEEAKYFSPMNYADQTINRFTATHDWTFTDKLSMRTALIYDKRELDMLRNAGGNGGNAANAMTGRNIRTQEDDAKFFTAQNELVWETRTGMIGHTLLAGIEYNDTDMDTVRVGYNLPNITNIDNPRVPETTISGLAPVASQGFDRDLSMTDLGIYIQDQMEIGNQIKLRLAVRSDRVDARDAGVQGVGPTANRVKDVEDNLKSGTAGIVWQPTPDYSLYAGISTGRFENVATEGAAIPMEPEKSKQKEIGLKATLFGGMADFNLAAFDTERENYFITLTPNAEALPIGHDKSRGIDLDLGVRPIAGLSLLANVVVQDPEVKSSAIASNAVVVNPVSNQSIEGTQPSGVAKRSARLWGTYDFQGDALSGWGVGLGMIYKDESYADSLNLYRVPGYTVWESAVFYRAKSWDATLNLRNMTDKTYYTSPTFSGALPGESRNVLLSVRYRIGE